MKELTFENWICGFIIIVFNAVITYAFIFWVLKDFSRWLVKRFKELNND